MAALPHPTLPKERCSFDEVAADVHDWEDNKLHVIMCGLGELNNVDVWLQLGKLHRPSKNTTVKHVLKWHVPFKWLGDALPDSNHQPDCVLQSANSTCTVWNT